MATGYSGTVSPHLDAWSTRLTEAQKKGLAKQIKFKIPESALEGVKSVGSKE